MPHIHTQPNQHDMTVSAYIVREVDGEWKCLVHMHRKAGKLMQVGGHIELDETPWQTLIHEICEESGYRTSELRVLQLMRPPHLETAIVHPAPLASNTHNVGNGHFHSDWCYGFVAFTEPKGKISDGESTDLRWYTIAELRRLAAQGECLFDIIDLYAFLIDNISRYSQFPAAQFSIIKPDRGETVIL